MGDAFWAFLSLLGLSSDDITDSSDSVSWGSIHCPVPVRVSDSVLAVLFNITHCLQGILTLLGLCPTLPIFLKLPKLSPSLSRMGHYGQSRTPKTGTVHRTRHSPISFRNILVESLAESVSHECPLMSSLFEGRKWDT